jgi:hypothetical protein
VSSGFQAYSAPDFLTHRYCVFVNTIFVHVVKVSVVKIVDVAIVPDCGVAAVRTMLMGMVGMMFLGASHDFFSLSR